MIRVFAFVMSILLIGCVMKSPSAMRVKNTVVYVGNTKVVIKQIQHGSGQSFVHVHHNETTALKAAQHVVETEGGSVMTLVHPGQRTIVFHLKHQRYEFDPNRMFTDVGIKKTLKLYGRYSPGAHAEVRKLANEVKRLLPPGKIIAVHNNNDYSIKEYFPGKKLHGDAVALNLNHQQFYRNFYLVTRSSEFRRLKALQFNAILQAKTATDDGSLSVYLAHRDYINVEAGYGQLRAQIDMLKWA